MSSFLKQATQMDGQGTLKSSDFVVCKDDYLRYLCYQTMLYPA